MLMHFQVEYYLWSVVQEARKEEAQDLQESRAEVGENLVV